MKTSFALLTRFSLSEGLFDKFYKIVFIVQIVNHYNLAKLFIRTIEIFTNCLIFKNVFVAPFLNLSKRFATPLPYRFQMHHRCEILKA